MKNLPNIPDTIVPRELRELLCRLDRENALAVQPSKAYQKMLAVIDRLAGAYLECLADRDEWKEPGEVVQRRLKRVLKRVEE